MTLLTIALIGAIAYAMVTEDKLSTAKGEISELKRQLAKGD